MLWIYLVMFVVTVLLVNLYYLWVSRRIKKFNKKKLPAAVDVFIRLNKVDVKKVGYRKILKDVGFVNSISIGCILLLSNLVSNYILKLLLIFCLAIVFIVITYMILGKVYRKKGWTQDV